MSFSDIMYPFEWLVAWIMYLWHGALTAIGLPEANGWTWTLSIVGLVVVMRAALIRSSSSRSTHRERCS